MDMHIPGNAAGDPNYVVGKLYNMWERSQAYKMPSFQSIHDPLRYMLKEANYLSQFYKSQVKESFSRAKGNVEDIVLDVTNLLKGAVSPMQPAYSYSSVFDSYVRR